MSWNALSLFFSAAYDEPRPRVNWCCIKMFNLFFYHISKCFVCVVASLQKGKKGASFSLVSLRFGLIFLIVFICSRIVFLRLEKECSNAHLIWAREPDLLKEEFCPHAPRWSSSHQFSRGSSFSALLFTPPLSFLVVNIAHYCTLANERNINPCRSTITFPARFLFSH